MYVKSKWLFVLILLRNYSNTFIHKNKRIVGGSLNGFLSEWNGPDPETNRSV